MSRNFELLQQLERERIETPSPNGSLAYLRTDSRVGTASRLASEEVIGLVHRVFLSQAQAAAHVVAIAGITSGSGCSEIAVGVAEALSRNIATTVCLVEANFRTPALASILDADSSSGLTNALTSDGDVRSFVKHVAGSNFWYLPCGTLNSDSPALLGSERLKDRITELRAEFDFVILDTPPLSKYSDALAVSAMTEGVILVLEANSTRQEAAATSVATLRSLEIDILAAVLNKRLFPIPESIYKRL